MAKVKTKRVQKANLKGGIDSKSLAHCRMAKFATTIDALKGGTETMRAAGLPLLPKFPAERTEDWNYRRDRTFLYNGYAHTLRDMVAMPFSEEVGTKGAEALPEPLDRIAKNVDRCGCTLTGFSREVFEESIDRGVSFILVDAPPAPVAGDANLAVARARDLRPYFVHIRPNDLLGAKFSRLEDGTLRVTEIRFRQCSVEQDGDYGEQEVERITLLRAPVTTGAPGYFEIWRRIKGSTSGGDVWAEQDSGKTTWKQAYLPIEPVYLHKVGDFEGRPVLWDLASENVKHWQNSSDQQLGVTMGRCPLIAAIGKKTPTPFEGQSAGDDGRIVVRPMGVIYMENIGSDVKVIETSGAALEIGDKDLKNSEARMQILGMQALLDPGSSKFATEITATQNRSESAIQSMIRALEQALERCFEHAAKWVGVVLPADFSLDIHNEFGLGARAVEEMRLLLDMNRSGRLSSQLLLSELKRRMMVAQGTDVEQELARQQDMQPPLGSLTRVFGAPGGGPPAGQGQGAAAAA